MATFLIHLSALPSVWVQLFRKCSAGTSCVLAARAKVTSSPVTVCARVWMCSVLGGTRKVCGTGLVRVRNLDLLCLVAVTSMFSLVKAVVIPGGQGFSRVAAWIRWKTLDGLIFFPLDRVELGVLRCYTYMGS